MNFEFNEHGVCTEPEIIFKSGSIITGIEIKIAFDGRTWDYGYSIFGKSLQGTWMGHCFTPSVRGLYVRRETAIRYAITDLAERLKSYSKDKNIEALYAFMEGQKEAKQLAIF